MLASAGESSKVEDAEDAIMWSPLAAMAVMVIGQQIDEIL